MRTFLNRSDLYRFERLVSKLVRPAEIPATISFASCSDGLQFAAFCDAAVLTLTVPPANVIDPFTLPWATVKEFAMKKNGSVDLDMHDNTVSLSWDVNGVPQLKTVPSLGLTDKRLPTKPDNCVTHPIALFDALADAAKCVDPDNARYSLGSICLRGSKAQIISTDGRQALIQDGFSFPWENDVLCPVSKIFSSKELRELGDTVKVGLDDHWVFFHVGDVNIWLKEIEGKFPQLDQFTKNIDHFTWLNVDPADTVFVSDRLDNLPGKTDRESPVYVELKDHVAIRGHDTVQNMAMELRLTRSKHNGKSLTMPVNRRFLKNALDFGIHHLGFDPKDRTPLVGYGDRKTMVVMPLEGDEPKVEADKITVLASNTTVSVRQNSAKPVKVEKSIPATKVCRNVKPKSKATGKTVVLDDAVKLRQSLRETLSGVNDLIRSIKAQRRQDKLLRNTVASLRKLQNV